jgi:nicotinic acid mononucleotide adenylyltransferase
MNPPTPGHLLLIKAMIDKAIQFGTEKIFVLTSSSMDEKNPLPCSIDTIPILKPNPTKKEKADAAIVDRVRQIPDSTLTYKSSILTTMIASYKQQLIEAESDLTKKTQIENLQIIVKCASGNVFGFIFNIIKEYFKEEVVSKVNLYCIVGSDRADFLRTILKTFIKYDNINSVDGKVLEREGMQQALEVGNNIKLSDMNLNAMSASKVRNAVVEDKFEEFRELYSPYLDSTQIQNLYNTIKIGLQTNEPSSSKDEAASSSKDESANTGNKRNLTTINALTRFSTRQVKKPKVGGRKRRVTRKNKRKTNKNKKIGTHRKSRRYR